MIGLNYGVMPKPEEFLKAFDREVPDGVYRIENDKTSGGAYNGGWNAEQLMNIVNYLAQGTEWEQDLASSILFTLGFEWI